MALTFLNPLIKSSTFVQSRPLERLKINFILSLFLYHHTSEIKFFLFFLSAYKYSITKVEFDSTEINVLGFNNLK
jgi:hypothetical protein